LILAMSVRWLMLVLRKGIFAFHDLAAHNTEDGPCAKS
jgi:hypothetical protein